MTTKPKIIPLSELCVIKIRSIWKQDHKLRNFIPTTNWEIISQSFIWLSLIGEQYEEIKSRTLFRSIIKDLTI